MTAVVLEHCDTGSKLGGPPHFYHHATCSCGWRSPRGRGTVERCRRDYAEHERKSRKLPQIVEGDCSMCGEEHEQCTQFFATMGFVRICAVCVKRLHHRNIEIAKAEKSARYRERIGA